MWKSRRYLPHWIKMHMKVNINRLQMEYFEYMASRPWDAYDNEYKVLKEAWPGISKKSDWQNESSAQMALTEYDPDYEIRPNRGSNTKWDTQYFKGDKKYDGRAYSKLKEDLPPYFKEVCDRFTPWRERVILAKMGPGKVLERHMDHDTTLSVRFHIPIITDPRSMMLYGEDHQVHWPADGSVYFLNQGLKHGVYNGSDIERVHLIINMDSQDLIWDRK